MRGQAPLRGQVLIVVLWIVAALCVLALTLGHGAGLELKLGRGFADRIKAYGNARSGIAAAIREIQGSRKEADHRYAYTILRDEESRININRASRQLLAEVLKESGCENPADTAAAVMAWRGDTDMKELILADRTRLTCKGSPICSIEELQLIPGIASGCLKKMSGMVTVYGDGNINVNTVPAPVLRTVCRSIAAGMAVNPEFGGSLAEKITAFVHNNGPVKSTGDLAIGVTGSEENTIYPVLVKQLTGVSRHFLIESTGYSGKMKRTIQAVYDREKKGIAAWHEN